jgi:hypothetical protein
MSQIGIRAIFNDVPENSSTILTTEAGSGSVFGIWPATQIMDPYRSGFTTPVTG